MLKTHKQKPKPLYTGKTGPGPESNYDKIHCVIKKKDMLVSGAREGEEGEYHQDTPHE